MNCLGLVSIGDVPMQAENSHTTDAIVYDNPDRMEAFKEGFACHNVTLCRAQMPVTYEKP